MPQSPATREDIDDVLSVLDVMMTKIDERFTKTENSQTDIRRQIQQILNHLDGLEKRLEISEDERLVMAHQLTRFTTGSSEPQSELISSLPIRPSDLSSVRRARS